MAVVINEFEAVPQAQPAPVQQQGGGSSTISAKTVREIENAARKKAERNHRLSTY